MGFGLTMAKGLITAATKFGTPDESVRRIRAICDTIDFTMYDEQRHFATLAVKTLIGLRDTVAMDVLTLLASNDISYAEAAIAEIKKIGSNDYAETLAAIGLEFDSLRDEAWDLMVAIRGPKLKHGVDKIISRGTTPTNNILYKLLCSGSWDAIESATKAFYLRPETTMPLVQAILEARIEGAAVKSDALSDFFEEISHPARVRPFVTRAYSRAYAQAAVHYINDMVCKPVIGPDHLKIVDQLKDLFRAADNTGLLDGRVCLSQVLRLVIIQSEEQFAPEILHYTMHNPSP